MRRMSRVAASTEFGYPNSLVRGSAPKTPPSRCYWFYVRVVLKGVIFGEETFDLISAAPKRKRACPSHEGSETDKSFAGIVHPGAYQWGYTETIAVAGLLRNDARASCHRQ